MRWRLLIKEFSPDLVYLEGEKNIIANALSRLKIQPNDSPDKPNDLFLEEYFAVDDDDKPPSSLPFTYKRISREQSKDNKFKKLIKSYPNCFKLKKFPVNSVVSYHIMPPWRNQDRNDHQAAFVMTLSNYNGS